MLDLLIIVLLVVSLAIAKKHRKAAAAVDFVVATLLLVFRVIPGTGDTLDTIFMVVFYVGAVLFFFAKEEEG